MDTSLMDCNKTNKSDKNLSNKTFKSCKKSLDETI